MPGAMEAAWEFHLPLAPADLLRDGDPGRYVVQEVLPVRELPPALVGKGLPPCTPPGLVRSYRWLTAVTACVVPPAPLRVSP